MTFALHSLEPTETERGMGLRARDVLSVTADAVTIREVWHPTTHSPFTVFERIAAEDYVIRYGAAETPN